MASGFLENKKDKANTVEYDDVVDEITSFKVQTTSIRTVIGENANHTEYGMFVIFGVGNVEYSVPIDPETINKLVRSARLDRDFSYHNSTLVATKVFKDTDDERNYTIRIGIDTKRIRVFKLHGDHKIRIIYDFKEDDFKLFISELYTNYVLNNPDKETMHGGMTYDNILWHMGGNL